MDGQEEGKAMVKKPLEERLEEYKRYGWKCNQDNLSTLPPSAPQSAHNLAKWLTLEGRRSSLAEWVGKYDDTTGCIHPKFWHLGAWTQRMGHSSPNLANIPSVFPDDKAVETGVDEVKKKYDKRCRALFKIPGDGYLIGVDADSIQLRILAHYMESDTYVDAIISGDKKKGTDIHSLNRDALGLSHLVRDDAKTFIYAWLLGAGIPKISSILRCDAPTATKAVNNFLDAIPELRKLKEGRIKTDARRGYFTAIDGRKVKSPSEHHMLAGYLQSGEAIVMKRAITMWEVTKKERPYKEARVINFVHDETQTWLPRDDYALAETVGVSQVDAIKSAGLAYKLGCPLDGSYRVGKTWAETH